MAEMLDHLRDLVNKPGPVNDGLTWMEKRSGIQKMHLALGLASLLGLWLMFGIGGQLLCNVIGSVYPAIRSIKAIETKEREDDKQWLTYWVVFAIFSVLEYFSDFILNWIPFYWLLKCVFLVWCMSSYQGSTIIYNQVVLPFFKRHENDIDRVVNQGKEQLAQLAEKAAETVRSVAGEGSTKED